MKSGLRSVLKNLFSLPWRKGTQPKICVVWSIYGSSVKLPAERNLFAFCFFLSQFSNHVKEFLSSLLDFFPWNLLAKCWRLVLARLGVECWARVAVKSAVLCKYLHRHMGPAAIKNNTTVAKARLETSIARPGRVWKMQVFTEEIYCLHYF